MKYYLKLLIIKKVVLLLLLFICLSTTAQVQRAIEGSSIIRKNIL